MSTLTWQSLSPRVSSDVMQMCEPSDSSSAVSNLLLDTQDKHVKHDKAANDQFLANHLSGAAGPDKSCSIADLRSRCLRRCAACHPTRRAQQYGNTSPGKATVFSLPDISPVHSASLPCNSLGENVQSASLQVIQGHRMYV